jgi:hypothetical protein
MMNNSEDYLPVKLVRLRYGVCGRTLDRWEDNKALGFPKAMVVNGRRFWRLADLQNWERARASGKSTKTVEVGEAENASAP